MSRNWRAIKAIIRKDIGQILHNKMIWLPMIILPVILQVIMPLVMMLLPTFLSPEDLDLDDLDIMLEVMPAELQAIMQGLSGAQLWVYLSGNYMFAPLFLIVPLMVASIVAADSFVGERERRTMEALLYTPISDQDLFLAKVLAALLPALAVSLGAFVVYGLVVNISGYSTMGRIFFPAPLWWGLVFWLGPAVSLAGLGVTVLISAKAKSFMQAQQTSGVLVLPIVILMIGQISGVLFLSPGLTMILGLPIWLLGLWLVWIGSHSFRRGELIMRV